LFKIETFHSKERLQ